MSRPAGDRTVASTVDPPDVSPEPSGDPEPTTRTGALAWSRVIVGGAAGTPATASLVIASPGGDEVTVADDVAYRAAPAWSPDGRELAFVADGVLSTVQADAGAARRLVACRPPTCLGIGAPAWSPDGATIAVPVVTDAGEGIGVVDVDEPALEPMIEVVPLGAATWSPDGLALAVATDDGIAVLDPRDGTSSRTIPVSGRLAGGIAWSPDGATFAFDASVGGDDGIWVVPAEGGAPALLSSCHEAGCTDVDPAWSPDGRRVVFTRATCDAPGADCFTGDLFRVAARGGAARPLVVGPALDCCAAWQPVPEP